MTPGEWAKALEDRVDEQLRNNEDPVDVQKNAELAITLLDWQEKLNASDFTVPPSEKKLQEIELLLQPVLDLGTPQFTPDVYQVARDVLAIVQGS